MTAPTRRLLLGVSPVLLAPAAAGIAAAVPNPDAELIRLCDAYIAIRDAYNAYDGPWDANNEHPMEEDMAGIEDRLEGVKPTTLAGVAALARVAVSEGEEPDGHFCHSVAGPWMERVARAVLRLAGGVA